MNLGPMFIPRNMQTDVEYDDSSLGSQAWEISPSVQSESDLFIGIADRQ